MLIRSSLKRIFAWIALICVVFAFLSSSLYIVLYSNHGTIGDGCPICQALEKCIGVLKLLVSGFSLLCLLIAAALMMLLALFANKYLYTNISVTLCELKIKLNN